MPGTPRLVAAFQPKTPPIASMSVSRLLTVVTMPFGSPVVARSRCRPATRRCPEFLPMGAAAVQSDDAGHPAAWIRACGVIGLIPVRVYAQIDVPTVALPGASVAAVAAPRGPPGQPGPVGKEWRQAGRQLTLTQG